MIPGNTAEGCVCVEQMREINLSNPMWDAKHLGSSVDPVTMAAVLDAIGAVFGS